MCCFKPSQVLFSIFTNYYHSLLFTIMTVQQENILVSHQMNYTISSIYHYDLWCTWDQTSQCSATTCLYYQTISPLFQITQSLHVRFNTHSRVIAAWIVSKNIICKLSFVAIIRNISPEIAKCGSCTLYVCISWWRHNIKRVKFNACVLKFQKF